MARQRTPVQINQFVGGINTEASPLNFPPQASSDEQNMDINRDGSRSRRRGFNLEEGALQVNTGISTVDSQTLGRSQFRWQSPGDNSDKEFMVVQVGNFLAIHDLSSVPLSTAPVYTRTYDAETYSRNFGYAAVDGFLVVTIGQSQVYIYSYDGTNITESVDRLRVRDLWGVQALEGTTDLTEPENSQRRPESLPQTHIYNLRNQTYALARVEARSGLTANLEDPISEFYLASGNTVYPSNSDNSTRFIRADANFPSGRTVERYFASDAFKTRPDSATAPIGYFVIDLLDRGASRIEAEQRLRNENPELDHVVSTLPTDRTTGGASIAQSYAGRVWYSGFSGSVIDGDSKSPNLGNYILFSRVVSDASHISQCYQDADPTSHVDANLVSTDGGFIKINDAYNIQAMLAYGSSLFVFAENGVWRILGTDSDSFTATAFSVEKLFDEGCISSRSVVFAEDIIYFWGSTAVYGISRDSRTGVFSVVNISEDRIKTLYLEIPENQKSTATGFYDVENDAIRWIYSDSPTSQSEFRELVFNNKFNAFTRYLVNITGASGISGVSSAATGRASPTVINTVGVTVSGEVVTVGGDSVTVAVSTTNRSAVTPFYSVITSMNPTISYSFGSYNDGGFVDWRGRGNIDTTAFLSPGSVTTGEPRLRKDSPYLTVFFKRTLTTDTNEDNSSCIMRAQWEWTTNTAAHKWSNPRQIYRPSRIDEGVEIIYTRNKIRGSGRSVGFHMESEAGKNMHIYGWAFNLGATTEE